MSSLLRLNDRFVVTHHTKVQKKDRNVVSVRMKSLFSKLAWFSGPNKEGKDKEVTPPPWVGLR